MSCKVETLNNIIKQYNVLLANGRLDFNCFDEPHKQIREFFVKNYYFIKNNETSKFDLDLELGLKFYSFLQNSFFFDEILESKSEFRETIATFDIPDIVADRFSLNAKEHYYKKHTRVYPYTLYRFIHLIRQGDEDKTRQIAKNIFSTDEILLFSERPTKIGINLEFYRKLALKFSQYIVENGGRNFTFKNGKTINVVRYIFVLNTSKLMITRPELYVGGVDGYINMLFKLLEK